MEKNEPIRDKKEHILAIIKTVMGTTATMTVLMLKANKACLSLRA